MFLLKGCKSREIDGDFFIIIVHDEVTKCMLSKGNIHYFLHATLDDCSKLYDDFSRKGFVAMSLDEMQNITGIIGAELGVTTSRIKCLLKNVSLFVITYISISYFMRRYK